MICENSIHFVIMLTNPKEKNSRTGETLEKCAKYWSSGGAEQTKMKHFKVSAHAKKEIAPHVVQRECLINGLDRKHTFTHIQFEDWPDFGAPDSAELLVDCAKEIRQLIPRTRKSTMLVHCSAGVGRTGTFVGLYKLMNDIDDQMPTLDVYSTVLAMRRDRMCMVQREVQYKYLYECTEWYLRQKDGSGDHYEPDYIYTQ
ncbi:tyrosine-protein phosphatase non-receptor type 20-like [Tigriopus californicus]|nr:tyrosine-protein phosphatase non-receptor type 20-like [Tigriopus californicus]